MSLNREICSVFDAGLTFDFFQLHRQFAELYVEALNVS